MVSPKKILYSLGLAVIYPAFLFSAGNTVLALSHAEIFGILLNVGIALTILSSRVFEIASGRNFGIPFSILAIVNFLTFISIEANIYLGTHDGNLIAGHISAAAFLVWSAGHLFAAMREKRQDYAHNFSDNPQTYYGVADMLAVNAAGSLNPFSFPFMVVGFVRSIFTKHAANSKSLLSEFTAARIYGVGYLVGAMTSLAIPGFAVAQFFWAMAYLQFKKDT